MTLAEAGRFGQCFKDVPFCGDWVPLAEQPCQAIADLDGILRFEQEQPPVRFYGLLVSAEFFISTAELPMD